RRQSDPGIDDRRGRGRVASEDIPDEEAVPPGRLRLTRQARQWLGISQRTGHLNDQSEPHRRLLSWWNTGNAHLRRGGLDLASSLRIASTGLIPSRVTHASSVSAG